MDIQELSQFYSPTDAEAHFKAIAPDIYDEAESLVVSYQTEIDGFKPTAWFRRKKKDDNEFDVDKAAKNLLDTHEQKKQGGKVRRKVSERRHLGQYFQILREEEGADRTDIAIKLGLDYTDLALYEQGNLTDKNKIKEIEAKLKKRFSFPG